RALVVGEEAVQDLRVLAHDEVREQRDTLADGGQVVEAAHRYVDFVADTVDVDEQLGRGFFGEGAGEASDHGAGLSAAANFAVGDRARPLAGRYAGRFPQAGPL